MATFECLVDYVRVDGRPEDLGSLLTVVENDLDPAIRHGLVRLLVKMPPFQKAIKHRLDTESLVHRLWNNVNSLLSNDSRLRCDIVDVYFTLYGTRIPLCLPIPELQGVLRQGHHRDHREREKERQREKELEKEREWEREQEIAIMKSYNVFILFFLILYILILFNNKKYIIVSGEITDDDQNRKWCYEKKSRFSSAASEAVPELFTI